MVGAVYLVACSDVFLPPGDQHLIDAALIRSNRTTSTTLENKSPILEPVVMSLLSL